MLEGLSEQDLARRGAARDGGDGAPLPVRGGAGSGGGRGRGASPELSRATLWVHRNRHAAPPLRRAPAAPGDDREAIFQAIAALAVEAPRLTEAEETIVMTAGEGLADRRDAVVRAVKDAADDEDASLDKLREALTYAKELPRTADVVRLEARVAARAPDDALFQARDAAAKVEAHDRPASGAAWGLEARELAVIDDRRRTILAAGVAVAEGIVARLYALDDAVDRDDLDAIEACVDAMPSSPAADRWPGGPRRPGSGLAQGEAADLEDARRAALDAERDAARVAAVADAGLAAAQRVGSPATLAWPPRPGRVVPPTRRCSPRTSSSTAPRARIRPALLCSLHGGDGDGPGDGGEYLLDGAALDVYAREDCCCFDVRVDGAAGHGGRAPLSATLRADAAARASRRTTALAEYDDLDAEASRRASAPPGGALRRPGRRGRRRASTLPRDRQAWPAPATGSARAGTRPTPRR
ncbi:hypothetical protein JL721_7985 [Aureococcus anophagefferens]|nr:hypothetical protein JL721_7985 [Aureococcus anophagefferens]